MENHTNSLIILFLLFSYITSYFNIQFLFVAIAFSSSVSFAKLVVPKVNVLASCHVKSTKAFNILNSVE